eukprot:TRINITY_DN22493_c0_g1_i1.p1 TRINITY_DN22493_c0_g1~~TRINITY_DN22493_c0_g1_i1.p1  ORF type:complete len:514 (+),score=199.15 TRINITY_DN22493_c0_g1_i1:158-1699(+)
MSDSDSEGSPAPTRAGLTRGTSEVILLRRKIVQAEEDSDDEEVAPVAVPVSELGEKDVDELQAHIQRLEALLLAQEKVKTLRKESSGELPPPPPASASALPPPPPPESLPPPSAVDAVAEPALPPPVPQESKPEEAKKPEEPKQEAKSEEPKPEVKPEEPKQEVKPEEPKPEEPKPEAKPEEGPAVPEPTPAVASEPEPAKAEPATPAPEPAKVDEPAKAEPAAPAPEPAKAEPAAPAEPAKAEPATPAPEPAKPVPAVTVQEPATPAPAPEPTPSAQPVPQSTGQSALSAAIAAPTPVTPRSYGPSPLYNEQLKKAVLTVQIGIEDRISKYVGELTDTLDEVRRKICNVKRGFQEPTCYGFELLDGISLPLSTRLEMLRQPQIRLVLNDAAEKKKVVLLDVMRIKSWDVLNPDTFQLIYVRGNFEGERLAIETRTVIHTFTASAEAELMDKALWAAVDETRAQLQMAAAKKPYTKPGIVARRLFNVKYTGGKVMNRDAEVSFNADFVKITVG